MSEMKYYPPIPSLRPADVYVNDIPDKCKDENRLWQGIPSIQKVGNRLWAVWFSGGLKEPGWGNFIIVSYSDDDGKTWRKDYMAIDGCVENYERVFDPNFWVAPNGDFFITYAQTRIMKAYEEVDQMWTFYDGVFGTWFIKCKNPEAENPEFEAPVRMCDGLMLNKPVVLSTGEWVFPSYDWMLPPHGKSDSFNGRGKGEYHFHMRISNDEGKTFKVLEGPIKERLANFDESALLETENGDWFFFVRTQKGARVFASKDRGESWEEYDLGFRCDSSRVYVKKLNSKRILFVYSNPGRVGLLARLSDDNCKTWSEPLLIDERNVSYPDGFEDEDGTIYIIYDHGRYEEKEILFAKFTEKDIEAQDFVTEGSFTKRLINKI